MYFAEMPSHGHCIYAAAMPVADDAGPGVTSESDLFYAGVVVVRYARPNAPREEVFRDERLEDGKVWADPDEALGFALFVGAAAIRAQAVLAAAMVDRTRELPPVPPDTGAD